MRCLIAFAIVAIVTMREKATSVSGRAARAAAGVSLRVVNEAKSVYDECCGRNERDGRGSLDRLHWDNALLLPRKTVCPRILSDLNPHTFAKFTLLQRTSHFPYLYNFC